MTWQIPYRPALDTQLNDGCACPAKDCAACALATLAKRSSVGRWDISPCHIRAKAGISCYVGTGGIPYSAGVSAVRDLTGGEINLTVYTGRTRSQVRDVLEGGSGVVISVLYSKILGKWFAAENDFGGGHAIGVNEYFSIPDAPDKLDYGDPLADGRYIPQGGGRRYPKGWQKVPADAIFDAAEARNGGSQGSASITIVKGEDTEGVTRKARLAAAVHVDPQAEAKIVGRLTKGSSYFIVKTANGGPWIRDTDGGTSKGWCKLDTNEWVKGEALV